MPEQQYHQLNSVAFKRFQKINRKVNQMPPMSDEARTGLVEKWDVIPDLTGGDCDDYALTKIWMILEEFGDSNPEYEEMLTLATCWTSPDREDGTYHCVALIEAVYGGEVGTWVMDNMSPMYIESIDTLKKRGYRFHKMWSLTRKEWVFCE